MVYLKGLGTRYKIFGETAQSQMVFAILVHFVKNILHSTTQARITVIRPTTTAACICPYCTWQGEMTLGYILLYNTELRAYTGWAQK